MFFRVAALIICGLRGGGPQDARLSLGVYDDFYRVFRAMKGSRQ